VTIIDPRSRRFQPWIVWFEFEAFSVPCRLCWFEIVPIRPNSRAFLSPDPPPALNAVSTAIPSLKHTRAQDFKVTLPPRKVYDYGASIVSVGIGDSPIASRCPLDWPLQAISIPTTEAFYPTFPLFVGLLPFSLDRD